MTTTIQATRRAHVLPIAGLLLRGRVAAGRAVIDILTTATFMITTSLLLSVVAGARVFYERQTNPPAGLIAALGPDAPALSPATMSQWTLFACCAAVLLIVPLLTLSAAAARMGALGRDQRLAALRLLGASAFDTVRLATFDSMASAVIGALLGIVGYIGLLPVWSMITFQATPLSPAQMLMPAGWVALVVLGVVLLAGIASVAGLRGVRISPLGVSRRARRSKVRWARLLVIPVVIVAWIAVAPLRDLTVIVVVLLCFMAVVNVVGPLVLRLVGTVLMHHDSAVSLLAGRRILADPSSAWRNVAGLAFTGFIGGVFVALPQRTTANPLTTILSDDLRTGALLTVAISFVTAAASCALNQIAAVLDRRDVLVQLDHAGTPQQIINAARRREVLIPTLCASLGSAGLSAMFFTSLGAAFAVAGNPTGTIALTLILACGIGLVLAAAETCRPVVRGILAGAGARVE